MGHPSGILTFTTAGKPHLDIEREFYEMIERVRKEERKKALMGSMR